MRIRKFSLQTTLGSQKDLGTQPRYVAPGDPPVKINTTQLLALSI